MAPAMLMKPIVSCGNAAFFRDSIEVSLEVLHLLMLNETSNTSESFAHGWPQNFGRLDLQHALPRGTI